MDLLSNKKYYFFVKVRTPASAYGKIFCSVWGLHDKAKIVTFLTKKKKKKRFSVDRNFAFA